MHVTKYMAQRCHSRMIQEPVIFWFCDPAVNVKSDLAGKEKQSPLSLRSLCANLGIHTLVIITAGEIEDPDKVLGVCLEFFSNFWSVKSLLFLSMLETLGLLRISFISKSCIQPFAWAIHHRYFGILSVLIFCIFPHLYFAAVYL